MTALALGAITRLMERVDANHVRGAPPRRNGPSRGRGSQWRSYLASAQTTAVRDRIADAAGTAAAALPLPVLATAAVLEAGRELPLLVATGEPAPAEELGALRKAMEAGTCIGVMDRLEEVCSLCPLLPPSC